LRCLEKKLVAYEISAYLQPHGQKALRILLASQDLVAVYPPHSTHRLQPLDISLFAPLATRYSQELNQFNKLKQRKAFRKSIINHFEKPYLEDREFLTCLYELRKILYVDEDESDEDSQAILFGNFDSKDDDLMKEGLFRRCMELIDDYLDQTKGSDQMDWIDENRASIKV